MQPPHPILFAPKALRALQHTLNHLNCPACDRGKAIYIRRISASMGFIEASELYLEMRTLPPVCGSARFVAPRTLHDDRQYIHRLRLFFEDVPLNSISIGHLAEYQRARLAGEWRVGDELRSFQRKLGREVVQTACGPGRINQELGLLQRILRLGKCWDSDSDMEMFYKKLDRPDSDIDRALTRDEQEHFLAVAASNPRWEVIYWYALAALDTCFSSDEMRTIRQGDINLHYGILGVNRKHGKNDYRRRQIPITNGECLWALQRLLDRAKEMGCGGPHLYLFPARVGRRYDGTVPIGNTGLRKKFMEVRAAAGLEWFDIRCFRHTAITRLAEEGWNVPMIQARAGHSNPKMTAHYTQISEAVQRLALQRKDQGRSLPAHLRKPPARATAAPYAPGATAMA